ncbi:MAG: hypothetical protein ACHQ49_12055 [Elusimicrobiota bacterium]
MKRIVFLSLAVSLAAVARAASTSLQELAASAGVEALPVVASVAGEPAQTPEPIMGGIKGIVTIGPVCGGPSRPGHCPDKPFSATISISRDGKEVARATSDSEGKFELPLPSGTYEVVGLPVQGRRYPRPQGSETAVVVNHHLTVVYLRYDTGIR